MRGFCFTSILNAMKNQCLSQINWDWNGDVCDKKKTQILYVQVLWQESDMVWQIVRVILLFELWRGFVDESVQQFQIKDKFSLF